MNKCPYCGKDFSSVNKKGVHIADKHVNPDDNIVRKEENEDSKKNILTEWDKGEKNSE